MSTTRPGSTPADGDATPGGAIERLLRPRSIAVVGASATPGALGTFVLANLRRSNYAGEVHLINPNRGEIGGRPCLRSIHDLPAGVDAAVLAIPQPAVLPAVRALAERSVGAAVIFASGFAESGERGRAEQEEIARIAAAHHMLIEGPNCLGMVNHVDGIALTFVETVTTPPGERGGVGIVSQSGAMACVLGTMFAARELGMSYSISTGNEAASTVEDFLDHLLWDANTRAVAMIVEQFRQPRRFLELARRARESGKKLVLLHPGRSAAARHSAATHTGALAPDYAVMRAKVSAAGVVMVETLEELGDAVEIVMRAPAPKSAGVAVVTESGAFKALALDLCEQMEMVLPPLDAARAPALRSAIPDFVPVSNPLDLTAQGLVDPDIYRRTLAALGENESIGSILLTVIQTDAATLGRKLPPVLQGLESIATRTVLVAGLDEGAPVSSETIGALRARGTPYFPSAERAIRALARVTAAACRTSTHAPGRDDSLAMALPAAAAVPEHRAKVLLAGAGFPFPQGRLVQTLKEAQRFAASCCRPVALKAQSPELMHKSDAGGVVLNLSGANALGAGWHDLHDNLARNRPGLVLDGILVEEMAWPGVEFIVGGRHDADWGPIVLAGLGGIQAELYGDVRLIDPGLDTPAICEQLRRLKGAEVFDGFRGAPPLDMIALAALIERVGQLLCSTPAIQEIDFNPVLVYPSGEGVIAVDAALLTR